MIFEIVAGFALFFLGYIFGQESNSKAPYGYCARCDEPLKESEGAICVVCVEAATLEEEWSRWESNP